MASRKQEKINRIYEELENLYGPQQCALEHANPLQLLVATILSAQCTDRMVNQVTRDLFRKYRTAADFASASPAELEQEIRKCGYYRAKAKNIIGACKRIVSDFHGEVPRTMEELTTLPGVGRKTANVVLGDAFHVPGLPVDTHVKRLTRLLGISSSDDPEKIERELCANLKPERWSQFSHLLIVHGRTLCKANRPACAECKLNRLCNHGKKQIPEV